MAPLCAALLQRQKLLSTEGFVVDLRSSLDQVLKVSSQEEVAQVNEFAVVLVLNVDYAPSVLAATDLLAIDDDGFFGANDGEGNEILE